MMILFGPTLLRGETLNCVFNIRVGDERHFVKNGEKNYIRIVGNIAGNEDIKTDNMIGTGFSNRERPCYYAFSKF
jgi:hypothetical protein